VLIAVMGEWKHTQIFDGAFLVPSRQLSARREMNDLVGKMEPRAVTYP